MEFDFDDSQIEYGSVVRDFLATTIPPTVLREAWVSGGESVGAFWSAFANLGITGLLAASDFGGSEAQFTDLILPLEEIGRAAVAEHIGDVAGAIVPFLSEHASTEEEQQTLARIITGDISATLVLDPTAPVPGASADVFLVRHGDQVHLVPREQVVARRLKSQDPTRQLARCDFTLSDETVVTRDAALAQRLVDRALTSTAIVMVGLCARMLEMTVEYAAQRQQFGRVIGSFQAIKHHLSNAAVQIEAARSLAWYAGYSLDSDDGDKLAPRLAKLAANEATHIVNHVALQVHGGIGFTWEYDLQFWLHRSASLERAHATTPALLESIATDLLPMEVTQ